VHWRGFRLNGSEPDLLGGAESEDPYHCRAERKIRETETIKTEGEAMNRGDMGRNVLIAHEVDTGRGSESDEETHDTYSFGLGLLALIEQLTVEWVFELLVVSFLTGVSVRGDELL
jgi:hypothetical protein